MLQSTESTYHTERDFPTAVWRQSAPAEGLSHREGLPHSVNGEFFDTTSTMYYFIKHWHS